MMALAVLCLLAADDIVVPPSFDIRLPDCEESFDCAGRTPYCHPRGDCVECLEAVHCEPDDACSPVGSCAPACTTDDDCDDPAFPRCSPDLGFCVECVEQGDCEANEECAGPLATCLRFSMCVPGAVTCSGKSVVECAPNGEELTELERCPFECIDGECELSPAGTSGGSDDATSDSQGSGSPPEGEMPSSETETGNAVARGCTCSGSGGSPLPGAAALGLFGLLTARRRLG